MYTGKHTPSGWIGMYPPAWRPLLERLRNSSPSLCSTFSPVVTQTMHSTIALPGYSFRDIPFPHHLEIFPPDQLVGFKFLNLELNDVQNELCLYIPTPISPLPGALRVPIRVLLHTPGWAGAPFCPSWLPHASTEITLSPLA